MERFSASIWMLLAVGEHCAVLPGQLEYTAAEDE